MGHKIVIFHFRFVFKSRTITLKLFCFHFFSFFVLFSYLRHILFLTLFIFSKKKEMTTSPCKTNWWHDTIVSVLGRPGMNVGTSFLGVDLEAVLFHITYPVKLSWKFVDFYIYATFCVESLSFFNGDNVNFQGNKYYPEISLISNA